VELEQRIRALELEMKILKNEVQRTLLDVQEQVLLNQSPVLTVESKSTNGKIPSVEPVRAQQPLASAVAAPRVSVVSAPPAAPSTSGLGTAPAAHYRPTGQAVPPVPTAQIVTAAAPVLRKVSLEEIRAAQSELETEAMPANSAAADKLVEVVQKPALESHASNNRDAAVLAERGGVKLLEWLMSSATKVDGERDEKRVNEVLDKLTKLNSLVDRASTMEEALRLIEEDKLG
jgi:hypothetical protein